MRMSEMLWLGVVGISIGECVKCQNNGEDVSEQKHEDKRKAENDNIDDLNPIISINVAFIELSAIDSELRNEKDYFQHYRYDT